MRKLFVIGILLLSVGLLVAQDTVVNFAGTWTMNADKSEFGGGGGGGRGGRGGRGFGGSSKMVVEQKENLLTVETFRTNRDGEEMSTVSKYTLDGKECDNSTERRTETSTATWSKDGKKLVIESTMTMYRQDQEFTMESTQTWSIAKDVLTIESVRSTPMGEMTSKAVYDRAKE